MPSGRENKREAMSKLPIDETILAMWQRHNSSMGVYQRITRLSKQAGSLFLGMSPFRLSAEFGDRVAFLTLYVREAQPGERYPQPQTFEEKLAHARALTRRVTRFPGLWLLTISLGACTRRWMHGQTRPI
jgi:hypothetical protein